MKINILGVEINNVNLKEAVEIAGNFLNSQKKHYIVTPNPEFILLAQKDKNFKEILNNADLAVPDGRGLLWAAKKLNKGSFKERVTGVDLCWQLIKKANRKKYSVFLLGGYEGIAKGAQKRIKEKYPDLKIYFYSGGRINKEGVLENNEEVVEKINNKKPDILIVAFGQGKQEKWIYNNLEKLDIKLAIGAGGILDFIAGRVKRAPKLFRRLGLEWFWRLILEPWRIKRIFNAVVAFPVKVFIFRKNMVKSDTK